MTSTTTTSALTPAQLLGQQLFHLVKNGDKGAALITARRGWRDFPAEVLVKGQGGKPDVTFEKLAVILAAETGGEAAPAAPDAPVSAVPVAPVSAVPVAAPVSAVPVAAPVSAAPVTVSTLVIERTATEGTIIRCDKTTPKLLPILGDLGWGWARRGWMYLGDRDTAPNMVVIAQSLAVLAQNGIEAVSMVRGDEPARPVSAPPAAPVSAPRGTRRQRAYATNKRPAPVETSYATPRPPVSAVPVSAPAVMFQQPVSAVPVSAPAVDPAVAMMMQQMQQMQAALATLMGAPAAAPVAPVVAPVVPVAAPVSAPIVEPDTSAEDAMMELLARQESEVIQEVKALTWQFKLAPGAHGRKTAVEIREQLAARVGSWWGHHHLGAVTFKVFVDGTDAKVIHIMVKEAAGGELGTLATRKLSEQVVGTALTVKGIISRSTTKKA